MAQMKNTDHTQCRSGPREAGTHTLLLVTEEGTAMAFKELNIHLTYLVTPPLGIYPREIKTYVQTKTCTQMFTGHNPKIHQ